MIKYFFIMLSFLSYGAFCTAAVSMKSQEEIVLTDLHATGTKGSLVPKDVAK